MSPGPPTVLHVGHHPQPGGGFVDLVTRVEGRESFSPDATNVVALLDSAPACVDRARERLSAPIEPIVGFGAGPVSPGDLAAALPRAGGVRRLYGLCKRYDVDLLHANDFRAGVVASIVAILIGCPFVQHVHHTASHRNHPWLRQCLFRAADTTIHVSEYTRRELADGDADHVVVRSPIDVTDFRSRSADPDALAETYVRHGRPTVALIGRLAPNKGHKPFIRTATEVDANFLVVGSGDDTARSELESLVEGLGVSDRVTFTGFWEKVVDVYALADVVVVPSHDENLPKVIQEALAWKVPVVASRSGGIPELVADERTGLLVNPDDDGTGLATAIERLLADEAFAETLATAGHDQLRSEFDIAVVSERLEDVYETVV
ncbi:glycosyltransferase family 4 protein [Halorarum halophilum]|uniref:Glycosyltransferase family 4 protein n=1 Tax=Halorarum halophilum TaxID=2743090 RepID=A0A7D5KNQ1_9EURY|nr:glycosyltransferase family 4 protein [Halobaculum halophilum]QLG28682.1 glycosyltransferase family 4 protein [Halobaculum halophilum]